MDQARRIQILEETLVRLLGWIAASDGKAGFIFGVATAMLGLLAAAAPKYGSWTPCGVTLAVLASALLLVSLGCVVATVFPRTKGPALSVVFFGGIARSSVEVFRADMQALSDATYEEDLVQQCHINAVYAGRKYHWVKVASCFLAASVVPWIIAAYVLFRDSR